MGSPPRAVQKGQCAARGAEGARAPYHPAAYVPLPQVFPQQQSAQPYADHTGAQTPRDEAYAQDQYVQQAVDVPHPAPPPPPSVPAQSDPATPGRGWWMPQTIGICSGAQSPPTLAPGSAPADEPPARGWVRPCTPSLPRALTEAHVIFARRDDATAAVAATPFCSIGGGGVAGESGRVVDSEQIRCVYAAEPFSVVTDRRRVVAELGEVFSLYGASGATLMRKQVAQQQQQMPPPPRYEPGACSCPFVRCPLSAADDRDDGGAAPRDDARCDGDGQHAPQQQRAAGQDDEAALSTNRTARGAAAAGAAAAPTAPTEARGRSAPSEGGGGSTATPPSQPSTPTTPTVGWEQQQLDGGSSSSWTVGAAAVGRWDRWEQQQLDGTVGRWEQQQLDAPRPPTPPTVVGAQEHDPSARRSSGAAGTRGGMSPTMAQIGRHVIPPDIRATWWCGQLRAVAPKSSDCVRGFMEPHSRIGGLLPRRG
eukprot:gene27270-27264_t